MRSINRKDRQVQKLIPNIHIHTVRIQHFDGVAIFKNAGIGYFKALIPILYIYYSESIIHIDAGANLNEQASKFYTRYVYDKHGNFKTFYVNTHDTPLNVAIKYDRWEMAECLINAGADVNLKDSYNDAPIHNLLKSLGVPQQKKIALVQRLISAGADVNARGYKGLTPVALAKKQGNEDIVQMLYAAGAQRPYVKIIYY